jgi:hypothetical protein
MGSNPLVGCGMLLIYLPTYIQVNIPMLLFSQHIWINDITKTNVIILNVRVILVQITVICAEDIVFVFQKKRENAPK